MKTDADRLREEFNKHVKEVLSVEVDLNKDWVWRHPDDYQFTWNERVDCESVDGLCKL